MKKVFRITRNRIKGGWDLVEHDNGGVSNWPSANSALEEASKRSRIAGWFPAQVSFSVEVIP